MTEARPRIGVVGVHGGWSTEALADALERKTGHRLIVDMSKTVLDLPAGTVRIDGTDLADLDGLVIKKVSAVYSPATLDRLELLSYLAGRGVRIFSHPDKLLRMIDRLSCTLALKRGGIPMPETVITEEPDVALDAVRRFGEAVLKPLYSTKARGMCLVRAGDRDAAAALEAFRADNPVMYVQKKVPIPGRDLGVIFLGGEYLGAYARVPGDAAWNTTIHSGGRYEPCEPSHDVLEVARRAQALFGLAFTGVDVIETKEGPLVFEVSAFGGFRGLRDALGVDAASLYADYVVAQVNGA